MDSFYSKILDEKDFVIVELEGKSDNINFKKTVKEIYNLVLQEEIRYSIKLETKNIRELIYKKAMNEKEK